MSTTETLLDLLWEAILRSGRCAACGLAPVREGAATTPWRCPRCGCLSTDDPVRWSPIGRVADPVGAEEPRLESEPGFPEDEDEDDPAFDRLGGRGRLQLGPHHR